MDQSNPKDLLKFRADPLLRRAIKVRAAFEDVDLQDVIVAILTEALAAEIEELRRRGIVKTPASPASPKKPVRKKGDPVA